MTTTNQNREEKGKKRRLLVALLLLFIATILAVGTIVAFFTDVVSTDTNLTTGSLDIEATYTYALNGQPAAATITDLKPGDSVVITATVTNNGSMSAWVREIVEFNGLDPFAGFIEVYRGSFTTEQITGGGATDALTLTDNRAISDVRVLDGTATNEQAAGGGFDFIGGTSYSESYTVYLLPTAGNDLQTTNLGLNLTTQALQYANNNATLPAPAAWNAVTPLA